MNKPLWVVLLTVGWLAPASAHAGVYAGPTKDGDPVVITSSTKEIRSVSTHWIVGCPSGARISFAGTARFFGRPSGPPTRLLTNKLDLYTTPLSSKGKFTGNFYGMLDLGGGYHGQVSGFLSGTLKTTAATGGHSVLVTVFDPDGNILERCSTDAPWKKLGRGPGIYGGTTSQDEPVVIQLDKRRTKIEDMFVGYRADCQGDGGWLQPSGDFTFPLSRRGTFSAQFNEKTELEGGGTREYVYNFLNGKVGRKSASGTLHIWANDTGVPGSQDEICSTPPDVKWKAVSG